MSKENKKTRKYVIPQKLVEELIDSLGFETIEDKKVPTHSYSVVDLGFEKLTNGIVDVNGEITTPATFSENKEIDILYDDRSCDSFPESWEQYKVTPTNGGHHKFLNI